MVAVDLTLEVRVSVVLAEVSVEVLVESDLPASVDRNQAME